MLRNINHRHRTSSLSAMSPHLNLSSESSPTNPPRPSSAFETKKDGSKKSRYSDLFTQMEDLSVQEPAKNTSPGHPVASKSLTTAERKSNYDESSTAISTEKGLTFLSGNDYKALLSGATPAFVPKPKIPTGPKDPNRPRNPFAVRAPGPTPFRSARSHQETERVVSGTYHMGMRDSWNPTQHGSTDMFQNEQQQLEDHNGYGQGYATQQDYGYGYMGNDAYGASGHCHNTSYDSTDYSTFDHSTGPPTPVNGYRGAPKLRNLRGQERWDTFIAQSRAQNIPQVILDSPSNLPLIDQPASALPPSHPSLPPKPPTSYTRRGDRTMKEIVIYASGAVRNIVHVSLHNLPYGEQYETVEPKYDPGKYNLIEDFNSWSIEDKQKMLRKSGVELRVDIPKDYENPVEVPRWSSAIAKVTIKTNEGKGKGKAADLNPSELDNAVTTHERTVIDTLDILGPSFTNNIKRCVVTLVFPSNPLLTPLNTAINLAPLHGAPVRSPSFLFLEKLCHYIDEHFTSLSALTVLLRVPSNVRMPLTLPQLYHVLPFYDLSLLDWEIKYQPDNLTLALKVSGWSITQLDRERDRVVVGRNERMARERRDVERGLEKEVSRGRRTLRG